MAFIPGTPGADTLTGTDQADVIFGRRGNDSISGGQADGDSQFPSISNDGRYVAFASGANNLVPGDTNGVVDIFVRDRVAGTTERVSVAADGTQGNGASLVPSISDDGRYVAYHSNASNLVSGDTDSTVGSRGTAPACGDLEGATISYAYGVTNHHRVLLDGEDLTVGPAVELTNFPGFAPYVGYVDLFGNSPIIHFDSDAKFGTGTFNGFTLQDSYNQVPDITGVTLTENGGSTSGLDQNDITSGANRVSVNLSGTAFATGSDIVMTFSFAPHSRANRVSCCMPDRRRTLAAICVSSPPGRKASAWHRGIGSASSNLRSRCGSKPFPTS